MPLRPLPGFLLRAPLLPLRALPRAGEALRRHPLGPGALELASPDLAAGAARRSGTRGRGDPRGGDVAPAIARYGRRAAFRPTPAGWLAGVAVGALGARTALETGPARPHLRPSWARLRTLARALLDDPELRPHVALRAAPSLAVRAGVATWLAFGPGGGLDVAERELDELTGAVLSLADSWRPWVDVHRLVVGLHAAGEDVDEDVDADEASVDELLLLLVDEGLLHHDLDPPLVGPSSPWEALQARLAALPAPPYGLLTETRAALDEIARACAAGEVGDARARLAALPGADGAGRGDLHGLLTIEAKAARLDRRVVGRAAACAPLLFRLQEALAAPVAERALDEPLLAQLEALAEVFGAGALEVGGLLVGSYGVALAASGEEAGVGPALPGSGLLAWLAEAVVEAARARRPEIALDAAALDPLLPGVAPPPTFELVLTPGREPPRARAGQGWLLGLHAPAGASFGRYAEALGPAGAELLRALAAEERAARPGERALDVIFAPSPELADLCVHPPAREEALALCGWGAGEALSPDDLELVVDPAAAEPLALRDRAGHPVAPRPLHRVRSTTAPPGLYRLLAGWSFARQHAPWAFSWGPLAALPWLPRVVLDGFVVAPASWRLPPREALASGAALRAWRTAHRVPALVQIGEGDELLPIDLRTDEGREALGRAGAGRLHEIWPPLDRPADKGGRRVEAVVAVVDLPDGEEEGARRAAIAATAAAGDVPPPALQPPAEGWVTFKLFGAEERQDAVLLEVVAPAIRAAREAGELDAWFFLRYQDPPGARPHLRLRALAGSEAQRAAFAERLGRHLAGSRASEDVVVVDRAEYFRELARYGGPEAMAAVEQIFERGSELALDLLAAEREAALPPEGDRTELCARAFEALARGLGLDAPARRALAERRRRAYGVDAGDERGRALAGEYRRRARRLQAAMQATPEAPSPNREDDPFASLFAAHEAALAGLVASEPAPVREALVRSLPALLHLDAVRLVGARPDDEAAAVVFWERTLDALAARRRRT